MNLGLSLKAEIFLGLTLRVGIITCGTGRTTLIKGISHLVIFARSRFPAALP
jgi:Ca2+:H+ antiporter